MRHNALGIIDIQGYSNAIYLTDLVLKKAEVSLLGCEKKLGGRLVTIIFSGSVSSITEIIDYVNRLYEGNKSLKVAGIISNPSDEIMKFIDKSSEEKPVPVKKRKTRKSKNSQTKVQPENIAKDTIKDKEKAVDKNSKRNVVKDETTKKQNE